MDDERRPERARHRDGFGRPLRAVRRNADVKRLALTHQGVERTHGFLDGRHRIRAVRIKNVDVVETHSRERLFGGRDQVLARTVVAVGTRPHVVAGLRRDDELIAVRREVFPHHPSEVRLGGADLALGVEGPVVAEVPPQAERDRRKVQAGGADLAVIGVAVTVFRRHVGAVEFVCGRKPDAVAHPSRLAMPTDPGAALRKAAAMRSNSSMPSSSPRAVGATPAAVRIAEASAALPPSTAASA